MQRLKREGNKTLTSLSERSQWLASSKDVKRSVSFSYDSFNAVEQVTKRLEQLKLERIERLKELARFRTLQDEAEKVSCCVKATFSLSKFQNRICHMDCKKKSIMSHK